MELTYDPAEVSNLPSVSEVYATTDGHHSTSTHSRNLWDTVQSLVSFQVVSQKGSILTNRPAIKAPILPAKAHNAVPAVKSVTANKLAPLLPMISAKRPYSLFFLFSSAHHGGMGMDAKCRGEGRGEKAYGVKVAVERR